RRPAWSAAATATSVPASAPSTPATATEPPARCRAGAPLPGIAASRGCRPTWPAARHGLQPVGQAVLAAEEAGLVVQVRRWARIGQPRTARMTAMRRFAFLLALLLA